MGRLIHHLVVSVVYVHLICNIKLRFRVHAATSPCSFSISPTRPNGMRRLYHDNAVKIDVGFRDKTARAVRESPGCRHGRRDGKIAIQRTDQRGSRRCGYKEGRGPPPKSEKKTGVNNETPIQTTNNLTFRRKSYRQIILILCAGYWVNF